MEEATVKASYGSLCDEERKSQKLTGNIDLHIIQNTELLKYKKTPKKTPQHQTIVSHQTARDKRNIKSTDSERSICWGH